MSERGNWICAKHEWISESCRLQFFLFPSCDFVTFVVKKSKTTKATKVHEGESANYHHIPLCLSMSSKELGHVGGASGHAGEGLDSRGRQGQAQNALMLIESL